MAKTFKEVAHHYIGCELQKGGILTAGLLQAANDAGFDAWAEVKPHLRPLESMTEEEAHHLAWLNMQDPNTDEPETLPAIDEVDITIVPADGGNMVDGDCALVIEIECRCFIGQLAVKLNGDLEMRDTELDQRLELANQAQSFHYLCYRSFNVFGLLESEYITKP